MPTLVNILCFCIGVLSLAITVHPDDILGCGGFVKSEVEINFSLIEVKLYTKQGSLKYQTDCAPNNGYYMIPVYDKGDYVLKVEPPPGWTFEPNSVDLHIDGETDKCSRNEDVNFRFTGFGVIGKVISEGDVSGPAGVTLTLYKGQGQVVQETTSVTGGSFTFEKVLPGSYIVDASHKVWQFKKSSVEVTVGRETGNAGSLLSVSGYEVKGRVVNEGDAVRDVKFILFSKSTKQVSQCNTAPADNFPAVSGMQFVCFVQSDEAGNFYFPVVPQGSYQLLPFYKGDNMKFDVVPNQIQFTISHDSVFIQEAFQVAGFSVSGRVMVSKKSRGVAGAVVLLNGRQVALTDADGWYYLDSMKAGAYEMDVSAPRLQFTHTRVQITPNTPRLADALADRLELCGQVVIDKLPSSLADDPHARSVTLIVRSEAGVKYEMGVGSDGHFCHMLKPDTYTLKVGLSTRQLQAGLSLAGPNKQVDLRDAPVSGVLFSQFRARVTGTVHCLGDCGQLQISLTAIGGNEEQQVTLTKLGTAKTATYEFTDVLPSKYKVGLLEDLRCWKDAIHQIEIEISHLTDVDFVQSGYVLSVSASHDLRLSYALDGAAAGTDQFEVLRGLNRFCLSRPGVYTLTPQTCHQFEQTSYKYDTSSPSLVSLTAVRHLVQGDITIPERHSDILVTIRSSLDSVAPVVVGPLQCDAEAGPDGGAKTAGPFTYKFTHWAQTNEVLDVSAQSGLMLFYPSAVKVSLNTGVCPSGVVSLTGRRGVFIEGEIEPALAGVQISITPLTPPSTVIRVLTNSAGRYRVGPLDGDTEYSVDGEKEGHVLTAIPDRPRHFKAFKLAEISVIMVDEAGAPLAGVLLSLSGGANYRSNSLSVADGQKSFMSLSPGQYFLRPMMKEFRFDPASQMIDVTEGSTVSLNITGTRIAFSCYGVVTSLNGEPEAGVFVEAVSRDGGAGCGTLQEEGKTEADGSFRIRGLQPRCQYDVHLRIGDNVNQHIERATPAQRLLQVNDADIRNVKIIAFRRTNQLDLSGNVMTSQDHLSTLVVRLYKEKNIDVAVHTISLAVSSFFYLPSIPSDGQIYVLRLDSTLSKASYKYDISEVTFAADSSYKHFTFNFTAMRKSLEQELSGTSYMILPLTAIVILLIYTQATWLPLLMQGAEAIQGRVSEQVQGSPAPYHRNSEEEATPQPFIDSTVAGGAVKRKPRTRKT